MGKSKIIDQNLRKRIVGLHTNVLGYRNISSHLYVPFSSFATRVRHWKTCFSTRPPKSSDRPRKVTGHTARLLAWKFGNVPPITLKEIQGGLELSGVKVSRDTISRSLCRYDIFSGPPRKKKNTS